MGILTRSRRLRLHGLVVALAVSVTGCNLVPFDANATYAAIFAQDLDHVGSLQVENWNRSDGNDAVVPVAFFPDSLYLDGTATRSRSSGYLVTQIRERLEIYYIDDTLQPSQKQSIFINSSTGVLAWQPFHVPVGTTERQEAIDAGNPEPTPGLLILMGNGVEPRTQVFRYTRASGTLDSYESEDTLKAIFSSRDNPVIIRGIHLNAVPTGWVAELDARNTSARYPLVVVSLLVTEGESNSLLKEMTFGSSGDLLLNALTNTPIVTTVTVRRPATATRERAWLNRRTTGLAGSNASVPLQRPGSTTVAQNIAYAAALTPGQVSLYTFATGFSADSGRVTYRWDPSGDGADYGVVGGELTPAYRRVDGTVFDGRSGRVRVGRVGAAKSTRDLGTLFYLGEYLTPDETAVRDLYSNVRVVKRNNETVLKIDLYADAITTRAP